MDSSSSGAAARRILCRVLLVVGGSVAGTAIAWLIGSATAAAEPSCGLPALPGLSTVVCRAEQILAPVPVVQAGRELVEPIGPLPRVPAAGAGLGRSDRPGAEHHLGGGAHEPPSLVPPAGEPSAAAPPGSRAGGSARPAGSAARVTAPAPQPPSAPVLAPTPVVPQPCSGPSGSAGGQSPPLFAALPGTAGRRIQNGVPAPRAEDEVPATRPGAQPGVTPD
ncbi:hypothetical protein [Actinophytocola sp.]|uniref:hypothetical protein n=1 Tax=Actinophytocola sp. TaxID=1872138 RepID=UPI002D7F6C0F|nr:hypothetical protein [Actinophytocola sp.]HET9142135.1 hypothetical protein [Actinophytocola sp.]